MGGRGTQSSRILNEGLGVRRASREDRQFSGGATGAQLDDDLAFAAGFNRKDRDADSKRHWNGDFEAQWRSDNARETARELFGKDVTPKQIGMLVGAPDGARVTIYKSGRGLEIGMEHPFFSEFSREIQRGTDGKLEIHNIALFGNTLTRNGKYIDNINFSGYARDKSGKPMKIVKGVGGRMLAQQAAAARVMGVSRIVTEAAGNYSMRNEFNGYYTWARVGFNSKIPERAKNAMLSELERRGLEKSTIYRDLKRSKDLNSLFKADARNRKKGNYKKYNVDKGNTLSELWKVHGESFDGVFDLNQRSTSSRVLGKWMAGQNIRGARFDFKAKKLKIYN